MDGSTTAGTVKSDWDFLGVGWQHPRVALQYEMMLLLEWEARKKCIEFSVKVLKMEDKWVI